MSMDANQGEPAAERLLPDHSPAAIWAEPAKRVQLPIATDQRPILALDAGFRATGWAVLAGGAVAAVGCLRTKPSDRKRGIRVADADVEACAQLTRGLRAVIKTHGIRGVVCELPVAGAKGARANRCMGLATAVVAAVVEVAGLPAEWVQPLDVKIVGGARNAGKADVEAAVRRRWPDLELPTVLAEREHIADALGAYLAAENGQMVRTLSPQAEKEPR